MRTLGENYLLNSVATISSIGCLKNISDLSYSSFSQYFTGTSSPQALLNGGNPQVSIQGPLFSTSHYSFSWPISKMP